MLLIAFSMPEGLVAENNLPAVLIADDASVEAETTAAASFEPTAIAATSSTARIPQSDSTKLSRNTLQARTSSSRVLELSGVPVWLLVGAAVVVTASVVVVSPSVSSLVAHPPMTKSATTTMIRSRGIFLPRNAGLPRR